MTALWYQAPGVRGTGLRPSANTAAAAQKSDRPVPPQLAHLAPGCPAPALRGGAVRAPQTQRHPCCPGCRRRDGGSRCAKCGSQSRAGGGPVQLVAGAFATGQGSLVKQCAGSARNTVCMLHVHAKPLHQPLTVAVRRSVPGCSRSRRSYKAPWRRAPVQPAFRGYPADQTRHAAR